MNAAQLQRQARQVIDRAASHEALATGVLELLMAFLDTRLASWCSLDPLTLLPTAAFVKYPGSQAANVSRYAAIFFARDCDREAPLSVAAVARAPRGIATRSGLEPARRIFGVRIARLGLRDELRFVLTDRDRAWGVVSIPRLGGEFERDEVDAIAPLGPLLGHALRLEFLRRATLRRDTAPGAPGLIILDGAGGVASLSPEARALLPTEEGLGASWLPVLDTLARQPARSMTLMTESGPLTLHGTALDGRKVVIVERSQAMRVASALVAAFGFSEREQEVVEGVCAGLSTREIAFALDLSDWTVQDHLKSIFAKSGVKSRKKLVALLLRTISMPQLRSRAEPSPFGWFLDPAGDVEHAR